MFFVQLCRQQQKVSFLRKNAAYTTVRNDRLITRPAVAEQWTGDDASSWTKHTPGPEQGSNALLE